MNPGGKNYNDTAYGNTATVTDNSGLGSSSTASNNQSSLPSQENTTLASSSAVDPNTKLETHPDAKDHSILRQIVNPGGKKYDETAYGTTATASDNSGLGSSATASNNQSSLPIRENATSDSNFGRDAALVGGGATALGAGGAAANQYGQRANDTTSAGQTDGLADRRTETEAAQDQSGSHGAGRDAGSGSVMNRAHDNNPDKGTSILAGAAGSASSSQSRPLGDNSLAGGSSQPITSSTTDNTTSGLAGSSATRTAGVDHAAIGKESHLGRDAGIAGGLGAAGVGAGAAYGASHYNNESRVPETTGPEPLAERSHPLTTSAIPGHINPVGAPEPSLRESAGQSVPKPHSGDSHTGVLGSSQHSTGVPSGGVHNNEGTTQLNQAPADVQGATFLDRSFYIGSPGDTVSHGPHVPGEFPTATGEDPHAVSSSTAGTSSAQPSVAPAQGAISSDHSGRDAALAGGALGAGALGAGAYESGRNQPLSAVGQSGIGPNTSSTTSAQDPAFAQRGRETSAPLGTGAGTSNTASHNYGRDAAIAGGAGALGAGGAYAATRDYTDPTTQTAGLTGGSQQVTSTATQPSSTIGQSGIGPTSSSTTSAQDPAFAQHERETSAPLTSGVGTSNTAGHNYGRDAAVAGGAGALGAGGAYAATRDQTIPTTQSTGLTGSTQQATSAAAPSSSNFDPSTTQRPAPATVGQTTPRSDIALTGVPATSRDLKTDTTRDDTHHGRDAAVAGGAGAVGAGSIAAAHDHNDPLNTTHAAYGTEDPNKHNKLHKPSPEDKKLEKQHIKEEKHHEKELEKQHHHAQKQHEKDDKERRHAAEKAEKKQEKLHEKEEKEKKPSLINRILHRHKDDKDETTSSSSSSDPAGPMHIKENTANGPLDHPLVTAAGTPTSAGTATDSAVTPSTYHQDTANVASQPHAGLPVDASRGTTTGGVGATSGAAAGPDWEAINKTTNAPSSF